MLSGYCELIGPRLRWTANAESSSISGKSKVESTSVFGTSKIDLRFYTNHILWSYFRWRTNFNQILCLHQLIFNKGNPFTDQLKSISFSTVNQILKRIFNLRNNLKLFPFAQMARLKKRISTWEQLKSITVIKTIQFWTT